MKRVGAYLPGVFEEVVDTVDAFVLTEKVSALSAAPSGGWKKGSLGRIPRPLAIVLWVGVLSEHF